VCKGKGFEWNALKIDKNIFVICIIEKKAVPLHGERKVV
jgi:hypothetical protein